MSGSPAPPAASDEELRATLEGLLGRRVLALARRPSAYRSSFPIEELELRVEAGEPIRLLFKDLAPAGLASDAAAAKPPFLLDPSRELATYATVLGPAGIDAPACLGTVANPAAGRWWLFLEQLDGPLLWQVGDAEAWVAAARWLADLHSRRRRLDLSHLLVYDADWFRKWLKRALRLAPGGGLERIASRHERVVTRLTGWPPCFVHGEFYPSNVIVERHGGSFRVRPFDWEMAGYGPGVLDLAALTSGAWTEAERERLASAYYDAWRPGAARPSEGEFRETLEHARLQLALQWIGWSSSWSPPPEHRHDWLAEALRLADRLGL